MSEALKTSARFVTRNREDSVTRDQISQAMAEFDRKHLRERTGIGDNRKGWSLEDNGRKYNPKWLLKLATHTNLADFSHAQARETLNTLGFSVRHDPDWQTKIPENIGSLSDEETQDDQEPVEVNFEIERSLQNALRANIEQLESKLKVTDGGKEQVVQYSGKTGAIETGRIDISAVDKNGTVVVIELKLDRAGRRAIGQILGYMGVLRRNNKKVRGILVARDFSPKAVAAASVVEGLELRKYRFNLSFEAPIAE